MTTVATKNDPNSDARPLAGVRIVELSNKVETCGRYLADLGAEVILVEPPGGVPSRHKPPLVNGVSLYFETHNANKLSVCIDLSKEEGQKQLRQLLAQADIFIETTKPGTLDLLGLGKQVLLKDFPKLVTLSITEFGQFGPYRDYEATESVQMAMAGMLCRSGLPGKEPLLPPTELVYETVAVQAAWCALLAYWAVLQNGVGDYLDFSIYEGTAQILDPGLGVPGSAAAGKTPLESGVRGRAPNMLYPTFPCADGFVRICVIAPRQWQGLFEWMGSPPQFADPSYSMMGRRIMEIDVINPVIGKFFADKPAAELEAEGQKRGVPIAKISVPADVLKSPHFQARGAFMPFEVAGKTGTVPSGYLEIDSQRAGIRTHAPRLGEHTAKVLRDAAAASNNAQTTSAVAAKPSRPFRNLRIVDLGIIVFGAECGRIFSDQGADVIKVENGAFPDGLRQSFNADPVSPAFALGTRGKKSVGINLRSEKGKEIFKKLVAKADLVISNFKPGTLDALGLTYDELKKINPQIIMGESSALGRSGPMSRSMGYGPLVRASAGLSYLWSYPEIPNSFGDGATIYPDHMAARTVAVALLAMMIRRHRSHVGGTVSMSQAEGFLTAYSHEFLRESLQPGSFVPHGNSAEFSAPDGVFPCAGDDEWCVVSVRDDDDWKRFCTAIGRPQLVADPRFATVDARLKNRKLADEVVGQWTKSLSPQEVTRHLQAAGVPAGFMQRLSEYLADPHFNARTFFRSLNQPGISVPLPTENGPCKSERLPDPDIRPGPVQFEHTREIMTTWLNLSAGEIDALIASGDLEVAA